MYLSQQVGRETGKARGIAYEAAAEFNLFRNVEGANQTSNYWNHNLCKYPHTVSQGEITGPLGPRGNVACKNLYPDQAGMIRAYQVQASTLDEITPANVLTLPNNGPMSRVRSNFRALYNTNKKADNVGIAKAMLQELREKQGRPAIVGPGGVQPAIVGPGGTQPRVIGPGGTQRSPGAYQPQMTMSMAPAGMM